MVRGFLAIVGALAVAQVPVLGCLVFGIRSAWCFAALRSLAAFFQVPVLGCLVLGIRSAWCFAALRSLAALFCARCLFFLARGLLTDLAVHSQICHRLLRVGVLE